MPASPFGFLLKTIRDETRLSLRELSELSGVDHTYIYRLETGDKEAPSDEITAKLLKVLKPDERRADMLRYLARYPTVDIPLVEYVARDPSFTIEMFTAAAGMNYRGTARPDPATRMARIKKIFESSGHG